MKMNILFLTCASNKEADKIAKDLLKKHLIVCAKKTPVSSSFLWQGKIDSGKEVLLIMESVESKFKQIEKQIKKLHSYDMPVLISLTISQASSGVAKWIKKELK